jgi:uncharacterized protein (DUF3820 family)
MPFESSWTCMMIHLPRHYNFWFSTIKRLQDQQS